MNVVVLLVLCSDEAILVLQVPGGPERGGGRWRGVARAAG